jgi:hypothetical protein
MNQHHVGGQGADHGPKHAPGMISQEGGSDGRAAKTTPCQNRTPAANLACTKGLDWDGPVTEVLTLGEVEWSRFTGSIAFRQSFFCASEGAT